MSAKTPTKPAAPPQDIREAVRDTVAFRHQPEQHRTRPSRSNTAVSATAAKPSSGRRTHSEEPGATITEKSRSGGKSRTKKSQHADVIDRLDFTGVGPMFHHDGPFDACTPSRNKHKSKAPMHAWGTKPNELNAQYGNSAYPSSYAYGAFSNDYPEPPKKKVDAIAEAWGIHEPEPFQEFFAGGGRGEGATPTSSIYNGRSVARPTREEREPRPMRSPTARRPNVPPPQPIFVSDSPEVDEPVSSSPPAASSGYPPKRSKSLMHRIRKMRDAPNVPVSADYVQKPTSPPPAATVADGQAPRPTHRPQNSFLGLLGVKSNQSAPRYAPNDAQEPYVFIDNQNQDKALPATPPTEIRPTENENTRPQQPSNDNSPRQGASQQLGRKPSLIKRVGRAVRGR